jgi:two-component system, response regulator PdtaR
MTDDQDQFWPDQSLSVLIVEDEVLIAMDLEAMMRGYGHTVMGPCTSVAASLDLLESAQPDVAILDVNLRRELVTPVAARLAALGVPFVVCSAYSAFDFDDAEVLSSAPKLGKPIDERDLLVALQSAFEQARIRSAQVAQRI